MKTPKKPTKADASRRVRDWNLKFPEVGVSVGYHSVISEPEHTVHTTRGPAFVACSGEPVMFLNGVRGYVSLDAVEPVKLPPPCAFCAGRAVARCAWKVPKPTPIRVGELQFGDVLWFEPNRIAGPVIDIRAWGRGLLTIQWREPRGRNLGTIGRHVTTAEVLVDRPGPCGNPCCPAHHRELGGGVQYCADHWRAWETVAPSASMTSSERNPRRPH
jgi:hypothetical protein